MEALEHILDKAEPIIPDEIILPDGEVIHYKENMLNQPVKEQFEKLGKVKSMCDEIYRWSSTYFPLFLGSINADGYEVGAYAAATMFASILAKGTSAAIDKVTKNKHKHLRDHLNSRYGCAEDRDKIPFSIMEDDVTEGAFEGAIRGSIRTICCYAIGYGIGQLL